MTKLSLHFAVYFFLLVFTLCSCEKEYSCEDCITQTLTRFNCSNISVQGAFQEGRSLDATNYIEVQIQIDKAGFYLFSTEKINGIIFSKQGDFSTGLQSIKLMGTGVPQQDGTFKFQINKSTSCAVDILIEKQQPENKTYYYSAVIDGIQYESKALVTNGITAWGSAHSIIGNNFEYAFQAVVGNKTWPPPAGYTGLMIHKGWLLQSTTATNAQAKDFLKPGTYPFADPNWIGNPPFIDGVSIVWYDMNGKSWYSDPSNDQSGRSFKITSCTEIPPDPNSTYEVSITAEFNCKLYDGFGNVKTLADGKFYGFTGRY